jgi:hypothetical protein
MKQFSLLTYKVQSDFKPFWSVIIKAQSYYEALEAASKEHSIPIKKLYAILW